MSEKIEINTLITKHENKCKGCRFEMIDVEDPLWEYGSPLKRVLIDNQTGETYDSVSELVGLLNEQQSTIEEQNKEIEEWEFSFRTEMAHHRVAEKELQEKIREQQATIKSKDKQLERLYNYFQDYLKDEMSSNAFSEMWDFVKEDEKWEDD